MPPEGKYTSLPPRPQRDPYRSAPSPLARGSQTPRLSKHSAEVPTSAAAYPDPDEKWAPKRHPSGDGVYVKDVVTINVPDRNRPEVVSPLATTQQAPPRLQKSYTMPTGYMPQTQNPATTPLPTRVPLNRANRIQSEHKNKRTAEKHRLARRRTSFDEQDDYHPVSPTQPTYHVGRVNGIPRILDIKYKDPWATAPGAAFSRVKTAPVYEPEHITTSRRYGPDDVMTSEYNHMQPSRMPPRHSITRPSRYPIRRTPPPPSPPPEPKHVADLRRYDEDDTWPTDYDDEDTSDSMYAMRRTYEGRATRFDRRSRSDGDSDSDSDGDGDDSRDMSMPETSRTLATSLFSQSNSGSSASHGGLSRGRQFFRPKKARRLAGVANRDTISKDNTIGDEARTADILANGGKKICKTLQ